MSVPLVGGPWDGQTSDETSVLAYKGMYVMSGVGTTGDTVHFYRYVALTDEEAIAHVFASYGRDYKQSSLELIDRVIG